ncbi:MAG: Type 1 glutamine amidotransferase-like domain-containing protein [Clostridia bacterium]|nr:Type 1 glutamine amidotransferase-like domain-containing protein [Clostridia bacterium]
MVNILLERYMIDEDWLFDELKEYIKPYHKVLVVAFSFRDNRVKRLSDWKKLYSKRRGKFYGGIVDSLKSYGIKEENIEFLNYFKDTKASAREKVLKADILYFLGGLPDRMYERLEEFDLIDLISSHQKVAMGYSAGAVIQLAEYHLSPDDDYPSFSYQKGLAYLNDFYMEVHYKNTDIQNSSIKRVLEEKRKTVYATHETGAILVDNGKVKLIGDVETFMP